jgi:hypothetical protein
MKRAIFLIMLFIAILIFACSGPKSNVNEYPLQGAWVITYTKSVRADSVSENTKFDNPAVKLLTKKHFAFGKQSGENKVWGGGGEYTYNVDTYTESIKYHGISGYTGRTIRFKSTLKDDLWTISIDTLNMKYFETWKRIPE